MKKRGGQTPDARGGIECVMQNTKTHVSTNTVTQINIHIVYCNQIRIGGNTQIEGYQYRLSISGRLAPKCEEAGGPDARGGIECLSAVAADEPGAQQTDVRGLRNTKY